MSDHKDQPKSAAQTLDRVRQGGNLLIVTAHQRLGEVKVALEHGDFRLAMNLIASLQEKCAMLAQAEVALGQFSKAHIVKCVDIEAGMVLPEIGEVQEVDVCGACGDENCDTIMLHIKEGGIAIVQRSGEVVVEQASGG